MYNNNFNSYGNANHFRNSSQIMNSGNIAGINKNPSSVAGIKQNPNSISGIQNNSNRNVAGITGMDSLVKTNTGPAKQVMSSDGRNMIRNNINNQ